MLLFIVTSFLIIYITSYIIQRRQKLAIMPPKVPAWPYFGVPQFTQPSFLEWTRSAQAAMGPVFTVEVNGTLGVVLCDQDAATELFVKHGDAFVDRPAFPLATMANGGNVGLIIENGDIFREQRRFAMTTLRDLGFGKPLIEQTIQEEVTLLIDDLLALNEAPFDPHTPLSNTVANVIARVVLGRRFGKDSPKFHAMLANVTRSTRNLRQTLPLAIPGWVQNIMVVLLQAKKALSNQTEGPKKEIQAVIKERQATHSIQQGEHPDTFVDAFIHMQQRNTGNFFTDEQLVAASSDLFAGGMDTTATTIRWLLLHLARNPEIQEQAFESIKEAVGLDARPGLGSRSALPFLEALVAESGRLSPLIPFASRRAARDVKFGAWTIPAGTITLANMWAMHRDPAVWEAPEEFRPQRFLAADGSLDRVRLERLAPFGFGKRKCLGESLARAEVFLLAARLVQRFRFAAPAGAALPGLDDYFRGLVLAPFHFELIATPRY